MPGRGSTHRLLHHARQLMTPSTLDEILATACREAIALTGADRAFASCCRPNESWERGTHIECMSPPVRASGTARSALFAIHRRVSLDRNVAEIHRSPDTAAIFSGLACAPAIATVVAVPVRHRRGLWGELVLIGERAIDPYLEGIVELAELTAVALDNAQRLAFARRDQDRLLLIAEATNDALYDWNFDTRDFWWGGGILKFLGPGSDPVETTAKWKLERVHADDRERVRASLDAARFATAATWICEYRFMRADGTYIHVEDHGYFLRETDGRAYRMIGSMRDVSAMKALLAREQVARADAEHASRAKDEFLAMLGHELRNPLAPIVTGLQLMRLRASSDVGKELNVLERQAQHLIRLVDDLLDISRIEHAKITLKKERLEVASVVAAAIETASPLIESRMHVLAVDVPARGLEVDADRARLAQAIGNLLNNAAKYTEAGGHIWVRAWREGSTIAIAVRDTGIGIEPEMLPNVFNMFVQERQALDRSQGGLGLGLTIVRSLIELHGGTVEPRSQGRGLGSEFTIRIPAAAATVRAPIEATPTHRQSAIGRRILVVDDNEDAADMLSMLLERLGNTTRVAHDGHAALEIADEFAPDLAVLDIGLPEMDGYELARRLRARPSNTTRLIALSGYGQDSDKERSVRAGFDAHLVKPVAVEALAAVIEKLVV